MLGEYFRPWHDALQEGIPILMNYLKWVQRNYEAVGRLTGALRYRATGGGRGGRALMEGEELAQARAAQAERRRALTSTEEAVEDLAEAEEEAERSRSSGRRR